MDYQLNTRLNGNIAMTSSYHERASLQRDKTLYKFIWVQSGTLTLGNRPYPHAPGKG